MLYLNRNYNTQVIPIFAKVHFIDYFILNLYTKLTYTLVKYIFLVANMFHSSIKEILSYFCYLLIGRVLCFYNEISLRFSILSYIGFTSLTIDSDTSGILRYKTFEVMCRMKNGAFILI